MQCTRKLKVTDLNPHLICVLCGGYYVDATTIIECLHSFCRSCIVRYLETNKYCPICDVQVHKTKPLQNIRPDNILQMIVYKVVPGLYQNEMQCRREFYSKHPEAKAHVGTPEARGELTDQSCIFLPDEPVSVCLEYLGTTNSQGQGSCGRRYLRCPAAVSMFHLHKLIRAKFGLSVGHKVDIFYKDDILPDNLTLLDVAYIYQWKRKSPIHLSYQILESPRKRIKLTHDNTLPPVEPSQNAATATAKNNTIDVGSPAEGSTGVVPVPARSSVESSSSPLPSLPMAASTTSTLTSSLTTKGMVIPTVGETAGTKKESSVEWKEIQLQISENGIMSIAGVENKSLLTATLPSVNPVSVTDPQDNNAAGSVNEISSATKEKTDENTKVPNKVDINVSALNDTDNINKSIVGKESETNSCIAETQEVVRDGSSQIEKSQSQLPPSVTDTTLVSVQSNSETSNVVVNSNNNNNSNLTDVNSKISDVNSSSDNSKPVVSKLPNNSVKGSALFKSKTDKLEDTVRNISIKNENNLKSEISHFRPSQVSVPCKEFSTVKSKSCNVETSDMISAEPRPQVSHKVYPGIKHSFHAGAKDEHLKVNNVKTESAPTAKPTPMEVLNSQKKVQNQPIRYKTLKTPIRPWNPSIPRAAVFSLKQHPPATLSNASKETNCTSATSDIDSGQNPPPPKQPRFFKMRNMPRFLGNPSSGVKPMYQVAPGSELISSSNSSNQVSVSGINTSSCLSTATTTVTTTVKPVLTSAAVMSTSGKATNTNASNSTATTTTVTTITTSSSDNITSVSTSGNVSGALSSSNMTISHTGSKISSTTNAVSISTPSRNVTCTVATVPNNAAGKNSKQSISGITLMKIDPKTLSPIPVSSPLPHVLSGSSSRSTSSPQPKILPPPFTPGSPKHSSHYTNCRTAHSNPVGTKSPISRIPSPAHTGLIPSNPFIPSVSHAGPHLLYSAFANPFTPTDPSGSRLLPNPNSDLIRAMSALCSSSSAFHPSLPPSISMLFNPHHAHHHRLSSSERSNFKCNSNEKQTTQSPPPTIQRIPPSNPGKGLSDVQTQKVNSNSLNAEHQHSSVKVKSDRLESCIDSSKQIISNSVPKKPPNENTKELRPEENTVTANKLVAKDIQRQAQSSAIATNKSVYSSTSQLRQSQNKEVKANVSESTSLSLQVSKPKGKSDPVNSETCVSFDKKVDSKVENCVSKDKKTNGSTPDVKVQKKSELKLENDNIVKDFKSDCKTKGENQLMPKNNNLTKTSLSTPETVNNNKSAS